MRSSVGLVAVALGGALGTAHAEPASPALEVAGTFSGRTIEPQTGWRAALTVPLESKPSGRHADGRVGVDLIARFDDHGAPAENGEAKTNATSLGGGVRAVAIAAIGGARLGSFFEATVGRTRARQTDQMSWQQDMHWMLAVGAQLGTESMQVVLDFGWLVTGAGDGRIGPIASLGVRLALD